MLMKNPSGKGFAVGPLKVVVKYIQYKNCYTCFCKYNLELHVVKSMKFIG